MGQPDIEDYQVNITGGGISGKIDVNDLKDVNAPNPADGDVIRWDSGSNKWVPFNISNVVSYYVEVTAGAVGTVLPAGWSVASAGTGFFTITHNLNTQQVGTALASIGSTAYVSISAITNNSITLASNGTFDIPFQGMILI